MFKYLTTSLSRTINVYQGVSPSLLATMSLSVDIKGHTQQQLVQSLFKAQLISPSDVPAWNEVDRSHFTRAASPYQNKPYPISNGENMTDIFSHAVIINNLSDSWKQHVRVLDVGTGHGYLAYLIAKILEQRNIIDYSITGIDINEQAIQFCKNIHTNHYQLQGQLEFQCSDLEQYLKGHNHNFDVIIGGYYLEEGISSKLASRLTDNGTGIWPTQSQHGQALYKLHPNKQKVYLMETLFSMPVARSAVDSYFISEKDKYLNDQNAPFTDNQKVELDGQQVLKIRKEMEEKLRNQLKMLLEKYRKADGKLLTLQEMRSNEEIKQKLDQLEKLPKTKIKAPSK